MGHPKIGKSDSKRRDDKPSVVMGGTPEAPQPTASDHGSAAGNTGGGVAAPAAWAPRPAASVLPKKKIKKSLVTKELQCASVRKRKGRSSYRALTNSAAARPSPPSPFCGKAKKSIKPAERPVTGEGQQPPSEAAQVPAMAVDADPREQPQQQQQQQQLKQSADVAHLCKADLQPQRKLPPEDSDGGSDDDIDASISAALGGDASGNNKNSASRHVAVSVTSLAGKRHTKVVVVPGAANGAGATASASNGLANGRRTGANASTALGGSSSGGSHHYGDSTLRYRTDLDKEVIHFMFERYQQEQVHPTSSAAWPPAPSSTSAATAEGASGRADDTPRMCRSFGASTQVAAAAATSPIGRARRISVEEVCVPSNGDGEDKNIGLGDWHFFWMHVGRVRHTVCSSTFRWQEQQIINHFPDHTELTRKDLMYKNIKRYLRENQADNYARLTLHTATDWVSASAGSCALASAGGARGRPLGLKTFCFADSVPLTYNIPNDMSMFREKFQKRRGARWIVKPTSRSQGKGIFLIDDVRSLQRWMCEKKEAENNSFLASSPANRTAWAAPSAPQQQRSVLMSSLESAAASANGGNGGLLGSPTSLGISATSTSPATAGASGSAGGAKGSYIVSRYISNPLLIGGKKFDLRLYVLVTSYKPLVAYLHEDGFARFCATRYAGSSLAQEDLGSHLTNVALQKGDEHYNSSHGGKWSFKNMFLYVQKDYGPYVAEGLVKNIQFLIYHSLKAVEPVMFNDKHSYELYGYDILIDDHINPHLIEVNASPSMSTTTVSDRLLKEQVLTDTMKIIFPPGYPACNKGMPYWEYRLRTDLTTQQQTGFKLLQF
ncbi:hypothetical protein CUR178_05630 [Leishmania enriettii]|uniref:Tubulin tyrosine ligase n=1 Tax=Leishmania enriettii TaxID=5663 RepID=A0A836HE84_LEIEN|nr:hypothetical protein CUR178_05630 [Leishmania enriettii]